MARRNGLGKRLDQILEDSQAGTYPAYEGLFRKSTGWDEVPATPFPLPEFDTELDDDTSFGDSTLSYFNSILEELGIPKSTFDATYLAKVENDGGAHGSSASSRVAAYLYSHPDGKEATMQEVISVYESGKRRDTDLANYVRSSVEFPVYVQWQNYGKNTTPYISKTPEVALYDFLDLKKGVGSVGKWFGEVIGERGEVKKGYDIRSSDSAASLL